jgi:hypothetical protein
MRKLDEIASEISEKVSGLKVVTCDSCGRKPEVVGDIHWGRSAFDGGEVLSNNPISIELCISADLTGWVGFRWNSMMDNEKYESKGKWLVCPDCAPALEKMLESKKR